MSGEGLDVHDQSGVIYPFALLEWLLSVYAKAILAGPIYFPHRTSFLMLISSVREVILIRFDRLFQNGFDGSLEIHNCLVNTMSIVEKGIGRK
jgi:hypothetical protein